MKRRAQIVAYVVFVLLSAIVAHVAENPELRCFGELCIVR